MYFSTLQYSNKIYIYYGLKSIRKLSFLAGLGVVAGEGAGLPDLLTAVILMLLLLVNIPPPGNTMNDIGFKLFN